MDTNIEFIRSLVELMQEHDLSRIELREGESHLLLRRGQSIITQGPAFAAAPAMHAAAPAPISHASPNGGAPAADFAAPAAASQALVIRSPVVGTFYAAAEPDAPAFAKVGDVVGPDTVVCLVEAMKVFNEIKAEVSGRITKVLVKNAQAVEYDQPLFELAPA